MNPEFLRQVCYFRAFISDVEGVGVIEATSRRDREVMQGSELTNLFRGAGITYSRRIPTRNEVTIMVPPDQLHSAVNILQGNGLTGAVTY